MKNFEKFVSKEIVKVDLKNIKGGDPGNSTDTSECTWKTKHSIDGSWLGYEGDTERDGDWYPMC
jgi:hypothetical protein